MALQGDLNSFALPDVLRLLAGTGKSGRLEVAGAPGIGTVVLQDGAIHGGSVTSAPHAESASDVVFEILRFHGGSFSFEEGDQGASGPSADVESAIAEAEALVAEWEEIEQVVPSMGAWVSMVPGIDGMGVHVSAVQWRTLAAVGSGSSVRELADEMALTDLAACRLVKDLADSSLVSVREVPGASVPRVELGSFEDIELEVHDDLAELDGMDDGFEPMTELEDLVVDDRTVVMEDREDALLPEPLPGEGVAYEGEAIVGTVDGHTFDQPAAEVADEAPFDPTALEIVEPMPGDEEAEIDPFAAMASAVGGSEIAPDPVIEDGDVVDEMDEERGSLLKFLSTVKP